ncbi:PucR family transcriptional regulator [Marinisporobacter balticus]|uniref:Purine catabolism regulator n=1 Tax=Marinisporobacter balticus TaxID=2018667 RepID=A0A4R2KP26_9FIRM|nr:PucR family transcriptional regulator ligand-binding domain-containing protein [Marinisporobacter balticus]TCO75274.1 purine catabolism regulator [Marinisporobacter balticus]
MLKESGITIKRAMEMDCLKKSKIIAGHNGAHNIISRVNIMADPDILEWVSEGELLLTTAYSFKKNDINMQRKFIIESRKKKLAGIGIKIYPYMNEFSQEVINLADTLGIPIIDIEYAKSLTDIMTPIFKEIFNKQVALLQKVDWMHNELMGVVLKGGGVKEIIKTLKAIIQNPILIRNHYFREYIYHEMENEPYPYDLLIKKSDDFFFKNIDNMKIDKKVEKMDQIEDVYVKKIIIPILVKGSIYGHILIWEMNRKICHYDTVVLESASNIIALDLLMKSSVYAVEHRYKVEFFEDIISKDSKRKQNAMNRANIYKFDCDAYYIVTNILIKNKNNTEETIRLNNKLILELEKFCENHKWHTLIVLKEDRIYILSMWHLEKDERKKIRSFGDKINKFIKENSIKQKYAIGIGRIYKGLERIYKSMQDAHKTIEMGVIFNKEETIFFEDLGIYKIFCNEYLNEELYEFYKDTLSPLVEYDKNKNTEFVKTLQIYFETNGNLKKTSKILYTHYNTILYRMQRIKEITKRDIEDSEDRFNLETALKIMNILNINSKTSTP